MTSTDTETSLLLAVRNRQIDNARLALNAGEDPNVAAASGDRPLHYTVEADAYGLASLLLSYGADPDVQNNAGATPLHLVAQAGQDSILRLLLEYGADPNSKDSTDSTPLHLAAKGTSVLTVKLLIDSGADLEARDKRASTPRYYSSSNVDIARLLNNQEVVISGVVQDTPVFPIIINGNKLDPSVFLSSDALKTKYILVQCLARLNPSQRQDLHNVGVRFADYVSKNTYLCQYQGDDPDRVRELAFVVYVNVYRKELKITPELLEPNETEPCEVDVVFHHGVDSRNQSLQKNILAQAHSEIQNTVFLPRRARLTTAWANINRLASIDDVRHIEGVGETEEYSSIARQILKFDSESAPGVVIQEVKYKGEGQRIAVADSGLDKGAKSPVHPAFGNRVVHWASEHNVTDDVTGHGTHVCGSAVGDGATVNGEQITGTAPKAELLVHSTYNPVIGQIKAPSALEDLFASAYANGARVHSNSWGTRFRTKPFKQMPYTVSATDIDKFVWDNKDMVICFAAGNNGREAVAQDKGHIGAQAAAKNCITVGASLSSRKPNVSNPDAIATFSSRGPIFDGRHKPDVVAPGTDILSAASSKVQLQRNPGPDAGWCYMSGTSMATPLVAGSAAVLQEALRTIHSLNTPTAALIKALLVNGADYLGQSTAVFLPCDDSGFGRVNIANSLMIVEGDRGAGFREPAISDQNPKWSQNVTPDPGSTNMRTTLVWSDPSGAQIKNGLILEVQLSNGQKRRAFNGNVVQQLVWNNIPSTPITINVRVIGSQDQSPQLCAVVWRFH